MKTIITFLIVNVIAINVAFSQPQGAAINNTGATADHSAMLDVSSTTQGMLVPRMTEAQKLAISVPANGLLIYQTDGTTGFWYYNGAAWVQAIGPAGTNGTQGVTGSTGTAGVDGATGATGTSGVNGNDGALGATGPTGISGASASLSCVTVAGSKLKSSIATCPGGYTITGAWWEQSGSYSAKMLDITTSIVNDTYTATVTQSSALLIAYVRCCRLQ